MVGHGPESPRFERYQRRAATAAGIFGNDDFPFIRHGLARQCNDGVASDGAGPPEEKENKPDDEEGEEKTSHDQPH